MRVVIGTQGRVLRIEANRQTHLISAAALLSEGREVDALIRRADQLIMTSYVRDAVTGVDVDASVRLAERVAALRRDGLARVLFLSTDAVFGGPGPHAVGDMPEPTSAYGRMKLSQEEALAGACILRFTVLGPTFGPRPLLVELVKSRGVSKLFPNAFFSPVSTVTLNKVVGCHHRGDLQPGIHHLASERVDKESLVKRLFAEMGVEVPPSVCRDEATHSDLSLVPSDPSLAFDLGDEIALACGAAHR